MTLTGLTTANAVATKTPIVMPLGKVGTALQTVEHTIMIERVQVCASPRTDAAHMQRHERFGNKSVSTLQPFPDHDCLYNDRDVDYAESVAVYHKYMYEKATN